MGMLNAIFGQSKIEQAEKVFRMNLDNYKVLSKEAMQSVEKLYQTRKKAAEAIFNVEKDIQHDSSTPVEMRDLIVRGVSQIRDFKQIAAQETIVSILQHAKNGKKLEIPLEYEGTPIGESIKKIGAFKTLALVSTFGSVATSAMLSGSVMGIGIGTSLGLVSSALLAGGIFGPLGILSAFALTVATISKKNDNRLNKINEASREIEKNIDKLNLLKRNINQTIRDINKSSRNLEKSTLESNWVEVVEEVFKLVQLINKKFSL